MHPDDSEEWFLEKRARRGKYEFAGDDRGYLSKGEAVKGRKEVLNVGFDIEDLAAKVRGKLESVGHRPFFSILTTLSNKCMIL